MHMSLENYRYTPERLRSTGYVPLTDLRVMYLLIYKLLIKSAELFHNPLQSFKIFHKCEEIKHFNFSGHYFNHL